MARPRFRPPHPLLFTVLGLFCGVVFGYLAVDAWRQHRALDERGEEATATVLEVRDRLWPRNPRLTVEFTTADGRTAKTRLTGGDDGTIRVGDEVQVRYDPRDVQNTVDAGSDRSRHRIYGLGALLLLIGAPALSWFVIRPVRRTLAERPDIAERVAQAENR